MLSKIKFLPHLALSLLLLLETCGTVKAHTNVNELALQVAQSNNVQQTPSLFNYSTTRCVRMNLLIFSLPLFIERIQLFY